MTTPLVLPSDPPSWRSAVDAILAARFQPQRPARNQLKVGPYNFWPSTGTITRDGMYHTKFPKGGLGSFLYLLKTSTTPLPRVTDDAMWLEPDDDERPEILSLDDILGPEVTDMAEPPPHAPLPTPRPAAPPPTFDTSLESLPDAMRAYASRLIAAGTLEATTIGGTLWVRYREFADLAARDAAPPF
jgi:hypothetical protein